MVKIAAIFIYTIFIRIMAFFPILLGMTIDYHYIFPFFIVMILLPEISFMFVPKFRNWIKGGVEDGDGTLNKTDLNNLIIHYSTLWCIRLFVIFGLLEAFYGTQVREVFIIGALSGAFGIESLSFFSKKISK